MSDSIITPMDVQTITINPKVDEEPIPLECPICNEIIEGDTTPDGQQAEYHCGCDELRRFEIVGDEQTE